MFLKAEKRIHILLHLSVILAICALFVFLFFYVYLPFTTNHGEAIKVPDIKGKTVAEVESILSEAGLRYEINDSSYIPGAKPLSVLKQHPTAGSLVKENRKIYLMVVAQYPPMVKMPKLIDNSLKLAETQLKNLDLVLGKVTFVPSPYPNLVIKQSINGKAIEPENLIAKGTKIDLEVGDGARSIEVELPNLIGMTLEDARAELESKGLKEGSVKKEASSNQESGIIFRQKPEYSSGAKINMGEMVDLWYAE